MIIRAAEARDVAALAALTGQLGYPATTEQMARRLAALEGRDDHALFVADDGGACVGWIHVSVMLTMEHDPGAEIHGLVIDESRRGAGIGAALVQAGEDWAAARSCARLRVRSNVVRERTHRFYERLGFRHAKSQKVFDK